MADSDKVKKLKEKAKQAEIHSLDRPYGYQHDDSDPAAADDTTYTDMLKREKESEEADKQLAKALYRKRARGVSMGVRG